MKIVVGHLYPDYLNIYADRGNIAVLSRRAAWRGHDLDVRSISIEDRVDPGEHDLLYIGGGQDREQALVAQDLLVKAAEIRESIAAGAAGARGLRWVSAPRPLVPRPPRCRPAGDRRRSRSTPSPGRHA